MLVVVVVEGGRVAEGAIATASGAAEEEEANADADAEDEAENETRQGVPNAQQTSAAR